MRSPLENLKRIKATQRFLLATLWGIVSASVMTSTDALVINGFGPTSIGLSGYTTETDAFKTATPGSFTGTGKETTFGGGYITSIYDTDNPSDTFWISGQDNETLSYILYGIADANITPNGDYGFSIFNTGCTVGGICDGKIHIDLYVDNKIGGTNPGFGGTGGLKASDRSGASFGGLTDGTLFAKWEFAPGIVGGDSTTTLFQNVTGISLPASGTGAFLADCVAGPGCADFTKDTQPHGSDFLGKFSLFGVTSGKAYTAGFSGRVSDPVTTATGSVPEPKSSFLIGLGLLSLWIVSRKNYRLKTSSSSLNPVQHLPQRPLPAINTRLLTYLATAKRVGSDAKQRCA